MKSVKIVLAVLMASSLLISAGCAQSILGVQPIPPSGKIERQELVAIFSSLISSNIPLGLERESYNGVKIERMRNAFSQTVIDPNWGPLTRAEAIVVEMRRGDPAAAVGLALVGPLDNAHYYVVVADRATNGVVVGLVDTYSGKIFDWNTCQPAGLLAM
jgi:hypothetical protein